MSNIEKSIPTVPESKVVSKKRSRFSFVWVVPVVAALVGVWIAVTNILNQGPKITITFKSAEGLEANKTTIRYNGVEVGEITGIHLADDYQTVIATAKMSPKTQGFLRKDTKFWVVKPQISGATISGLSTIISGAYLGMEIGTDPQSERNFTALTDQPVETDGITGRFFNLKTSELGSLSKGTPIYFRRLPAGQVASYELDPSGKFLNVKIFVKSPYDQFVTAGTRFWHASGVDVSLTANGMQMHTESLLSILVGGIAFETPATVSPAAPAEENAEFTLSVNRAEAFQPPPQYPVTFKLMFTESLRGLEVGAPVELEGIHIGEVTEIHAQINPKTLTFTAPVTIEVDPARFNVDVMAWPTNATAQEIAIRRRNGIEALVSQGLRAQLKTGSLISGSQYIALDFFPDAKPVTLDWSQSPLQFPSVPGQLAAIEASLTSIIKKVDQMPIKDIGDDLHKTIVGAQGTLTNADQLLQNASRFVAPDSAFDAQLNVMMQQAGGAANALRVLLDYLERHPEALVQGKAGSAKQ